MKNENLKEKFFNQYQEATAIGYRDVLKKGYELEDEYGKDIFEFNFQEFEALFENLNIKSFTAMCASASMIRKYVDFAIRRNHVSLETNFMEIFSYQNLKKYVNKVALNHRYITKNQLKQMQDNCINAQDAVIYGLLFDGIKGEACEEIRNLMKKDVDTEQSVLKLTLNDGSIRKARVSEGTIDLILEAVRQTHYMFLNGMSTSTKKNSALLIKNEFVVRPAKRGDNNQNISIDFSVCLSRVKKIALWHDNNYITANTIHLSGMLHQANEILKIRELTEEDYKIINKQFGKPRDSWNRTKKFILENIHFIQN